MNGMQRKRERRERARRYTDDGLPRDAREWTIEDWRIFWMHINAARREIAARHAKEEASDGSTR